MPRNEDLYLRDILTAIERIDRYIDGVTLDQFKADALRADGVLFNLMTIGEAVKHIPEAIRNREPNIRWRDIGRFRDRVVHHYFGLDLAIVWEIITIYLPPLRIYVQQLIDNLDDNDND